MKKAALTLFLAISATISATILSVIFHTTVYEQLIYFILATVVATGLDVAEIKKELEKKS